jgi:hypothetical protein
MAFISPKLAHLDQARPVRPPTPCDCTSALPRRITSAPTSSLTPPYEPASLPSLPSFITSRRQRSSLTLLCSARSLFYPHFELYLALTLLCSTASPHDDKDLTVPLYTQQIAPRIDDHKPCNIHNLEIFIPNYENALPNNIWYDGGRLVHWRCLG